MGMDQSKCCVPQQENKGSEFKNIRQARRKPEEKLKRSAGASLTEPYAVDWSKAKRDHWVYEETRFTSYTFVTKPTMDEVMGTIAEGEAKLKERPDLYEGLKYQSNCKEWPDETQRYSLILRSGSGFTVKPTANGTFTYLQAKYLALEHHEKIKHVADAHTDKMTYQGKRLGQARHPGRGHGVLDVPHIKLVGSIHPNDIQQGSVGDCWLLSAISAMSEFDGAISALFRKTAGLYELPAQQPTKYVVTLFDLKTWSEVDIEVDERLCMKGDESGLLGCLPSNDAELWACYLEKAMAIHCGGWDELEGGHCTHAWRMLTGCKHQYTFMNYGEGFECLGTLNPNTGEWEPLDNSPHKGFQGLWPMNWPEVGGGGDLQAKCLENEMFERMCAWDDQNYIMAAGTKAGSDKNATDGIVDGHAYTVITCINDVAGTQFDLIKVRNPWGKGEFASGMWSDDGAGWKSYPEVKRICKPVNANDGMFWLTKEEFFKYFKTIYLCAQDMSEFITWTNSSNNNNNNAN